MPKKRKRNFSWLKWLLFLLLVAAAVVVVILVKNTYFSDKKEDDKPTVDNATKVVEDKKPEETSKEEKLEGPKEENKNPQYEGESPNASETLTGLITYADVNSDNLVIRVNIDQFLSGGNCSLTMSRNGVSYYSKVATIQESVTTSTCDGFEIPVSELPKGDLSVEILLESEGKSGKVTGRVKI